MANRNYDPIDRAGLLHAQIADLETELNALKDEIRARGEGAYEGQIFRATVSADVEISTLDVKAAKAKLLAEGFHAFVKANTKTTAKKGAVRFAVRQGELVAA